MHSATAWALTSGAVGVGVLAAGNNLLTAGLGASTIALYAGVYTPLKVRAKEKMKSSAIPASH